MMIAVGAVVCSAAIGTVRGLVAGYAGKRMADVIMSFPSLLLAVVVLYILGPSVGNLAIALSITHVPDCLLTTRAEVQEMRERMTADDACAAIAPR